MKTSDFLKPYKRKLKDLKEFGHSVMISHMVMDNIADLIPDELEMELLWWSAGVTVKRRADVKFEADRFDKLVTKLTRQLRTTPSISITKENLNATFWLYPKMLGTRHGSVVVDIVIGNTEACDIEIVEEVTKVTKLTGYCKALAEKQYRVDKEKKEVAA